VGQDQSGEEVIQSLSQQQYARRFKLAGWGVLLLGILIAIIVYWIGTRSPDLTDDPSMAGYFKAESRQMGMLYGKEGILIEDLRNDLRKPEVQAFLIVAGSVIIAAGCFLFARFPKIDESTTGLFTIDGGSGRGKMGGDQS